MPCEFFRTYFFLFEAFQHNMKTWHIMRFYVMLFFMVIPVSKYLRVSDFLYSIKRKISRLFSYLTLNSIDWIFSCFNTTSEKPIVFWLFQDKKFTIVFNDSIYRFSLYFLNVTSRKIFPSHCHICGNALSDG